MRGAHRVGVVEAQNRLSTESLLVGDACLTEVKVHGLHRPQSASWDAQHKGTARKYALVVAGTFSSFSSPLRDQCGGSRWALVESE